MIFLYLIAAILDTASGICFQVATSSTPRIPIDVTTPSTLAECKLQCIRKAVCESAFFNDVEMTCVLLGDEIQAQCTVPYDRHLKQFSGCPEKDPVEDYVRDPCLASATLRPDLRAVTIPPFCPDFMSWVFVVSVIYEDGSYGTYENDGSAMVYWNETIGSNVYYYAQNGQTYFDDSIYAASCAYYEPGDANDCGCAPLPQDPSASGRNGATILSESTPAACDTGYSGRQECFIEAKNGISRACGPCTNFTIQCINKLWILSQWDVNQYHRSSYALKQGTCYLP